MFKASIWNKDRNAITLYRNVRLLPSLTPIVHCAHCDQDWPCDTIRALTAPSTTEETG